ncbi:MAG TPA: hypothetical protein VFP84_13375 [Kofleriaceae bacterium]|nr:hypothetical protein [Kofleriaceae bacterium]
MKASKLFTALLVSTLGTTAALAQPQESPDTTTDTGFDHAVPQVNHAIELGVSTGYQQGAGKLGGNLGSLEDVAGPGGAIEVDAGYRILPQLSVGLYGTYAQNAHGDHLASNTDVLGATAGVQATFHARPDRSIDPWVSLGAGWKGLWLNPDHGKVTSLQGLELARLQVGADYRVSKDVSIAPVIGGSLSMFVSEDSPMTDSYTEINDKKVSFTGFAGLSGRFDVGGSRGK